MQILSLLKPLDGGRRDGVPPRKIWDLKIEVPCFPSEVALLVVAYAQLLVKYV